MTVAEMTDIETTCKLLQERRSHLEDTIKARMGMDQRALSLTRRTLGFHGCAEGDREAIKELSFAIIKAIEKGEEPPEGMAEIADKIRPFVLNIQIARKPFNDYEKRVKLEMAAAVETLPVWEWAKDIRGLDSPSLGNLIGCTGNLSNYANPAKVWKRMGLAVMSGNRQGNPGKAATADDWIAHGYSKRRRSVMWMVGHCLVMGNGDGPYRTIYLERKEYERQKAEAAGLSVKPAAKIKEKEKEQCRSVGHVDRRASRYMEKRFLRDLWRMWRDTAE